VCMRLNNLKTTIILGAFVLFLLPAVGRAQSANNEPVNAQCPAPSGYVPTFLDSRCVAVTLRYELKLIRVFSKDGSKQGHYLSTTLPLSRSYAIRRLALKREWGNRATKQVEATVPIGTTIYIGIAAPQEPQVLYSGGAQQTVVEDLTGIRWGRTRPVPKTTRQ
jgi:hypothetical protein